MFTWLVMLVVLTVLFALGWHNQPARNLEKDSPTEHAALPKGRRKI